MHHVFNHTLIKKLSVTILVATIFASFLSQTGAAQTVTQGYLSDTSLQRGMVVALDKDDTSKVVAINRSESDRIHGVVVGSGDATITFAEPEQKVLIATSGRYEVLVNDQNGKISQGDYIALSSANGIAMKSDQDQPIILGRALDGFSGKDDPRYLSSSVLKNTDGGEIPVTIGRINVDIVIGKNPLAKNQNNVPDALKRAGEFIAGKPVPPSRIYIGFTLLIASAAIAGSVVYSAVRSGIISIGRNPLSKKSIIRGILQMVIVAFIIFFSGIFGVYLILKL